MDLKVLWKLQSANKSRGLLLCQNRKRLWQQWHVLPSATDANHLRVNWFHLHPSTPLFSLKFSPLVSPHSSISYKHSSTCSEQSQWTCGLQGGETESAQDLSNPTYEKFQIVTSTELEFESSHANASNTGSNIHQLPDLLLSASHLVTLTQFLCI